MLEELKDLRSIADMERVSVLHDMVKGTAFLGSQCSVPVLHVGYLQATAVNNACRCSL
jgi:hypothetical protein